MTVHKTRYIYIRHRRVPPTEVYSPTPEDYSVGYTNEIERPKVETTPTPGGVEAGMVRLQSFPTHVIWSVGQFRVKRSQRRESRRVVSRPKATDGVLTVPFRPDIHFGHALALRTITQCVVILVAPLKFTIRNSEKLSLHPAGQIPVMQFRWPGKISVNGRDFSAAFGSSSALHIVPSPPESDTEWSGDSSCTQCRTAAAI